MFLGLTIKGPVMRGRKDPQAQLFCSINVESRIRPDHPLRPLKRKVDEILSALDGRLDRAYRQTGRPNVPPERLLKALLLMALSSVRSERRLCERIATDVLFRWFLDMSPEDPVFDPTVFTHNRPRLDEFGITGAFFGAVVAQAKNAGLSSDEHFSVDGTMIESLPSMKSFRPIDEQDTLGADADYDSGEFLRQLETRGVEPHVAMTSIAPANPETAHGERVDKILARGRMKGRLQSDGYPVSQRVRKKIEEGFRWLKAIAGLDKSRWFGLWKLRQHFELAAATYNLLRMMKLQPTRTRQPT
jgi:transposase